MDPGLKEHFEPAYVDVNSQGLVPALVDGDMVLTQTMAIIEFLKEASPRPLLLPTSPYERARGLEKTFNCEFYPIINLPVHLYLAVDLGNTPEEVI